MFYDLANTTWGQEELDAIQRVVAEGRLTMGDHVRRFEESFAAKFGVKHAVMVNSGSSANLVGIAALFHVGRRPRSEERRVGKECRSRWATDQCKKNKENGARVDRI